jgi:hypothetical protein
LTSTFISCFRNSTIAKPEDRWVKWNSFNQPCTILNVDDSCLGGCSSKIWRTYLSPFWSLDHRLL